MTREIVEYLIADQEKAARIRRRIAPDSPHKRMAELFQALSDPTRLKIVRALEMDELCVYDIGALLYLTQPSVSHHLKILRQVGIVKYHRSGKTALYSLKENRVSALLALAGDYIRE